MSMKNRIVCESLSEYLYTLLPRRWRHLLDTVVVISSNCARSSGSIVEALFLLCMATALASVYMAMGSMLGIME